jgi:hypothetical protein
VEGLPRIGCLAAVVEPVASGPSERLARHLQPIGVRLDMTFKFLSCALPILTLVAAGCGSGSPTSGTPTSPCLATSSSTEPSAWTLLGSGQPQDFFSAVYARVASDRIDLRIETGPNWYWALSGVQGSDAFVVFLDVDRNAATGCRACFAAGGGGSFPVVVDIGADRQIYLWDRVGEVDALDGSGHWTQVAVSDYLNITGQHYVEVGVARRLLGSPAAIDLVVYFTTFFDPLKRFPVEGHLTYFLPPAACSAVTSMSGRGDR